MKSVVRSRHIEGVQQVSCLEVLNVQHQASDSEKHLSSLRTLDLGDWPAFVISRETCLGKVLSAMAWRETTPGCCGLKGACNGCGAQAA